MRHLTAIGRKKPSAPMSLLNNSGRLVGRVLDYGCGRGFDVKHFGIAGFDPHFSPDMPSGLFDTITCNYVLNVIECGEERFAVIKDIKSRLYPGGRAYITVRNDKSKLNGCTSKGTWQGLVVLDAPVVCKGGSFITYEVMIG